MSESNDCTDYGVKVSMTGMRFSFERCSDSAFPWDTVHHWVGSDSWTGRKGVFGVWLCRKAYLRASC